MRVVEGGRHLPIEASGGPPDEAAGFADWVAPHVRLLSALAAREVGSADAEDLVQEALLRAWRRRSTFRNDRGTPRSWLVAVLMDQCRRHRLRSERSGVVFVDRALSAGSAVTERLDVEGAVRELPRRQREVVALYYLADLSVAEVAAVLGLSEGSVKSHLSDARSRLRAALEDL